MGVATLTCEQPNGYVEDSTDCNDADASINPDGVEVCDGADNDCDGSVDVDTIDGSDLADDEDGDGLGALGTTSWKCEGVDNELDCDDGDDSEPQVADASASEESADGSYVAPWTSIQAAIDDADSCVLVLAGSYVENIDFGGKDLEVESADGAESTIIDGSDGSAPVVSFTNGETAAAQLHGFTLTGGSGYEQESASSYDCDGRTCTDYEVSYCGGGLYVDGATPTLYDLLIEYNEAQLPSDYVSGDDSYSFSSYGGGACFRNTAMSVDDVQVWWNEADVGGGVYVESTADISWSQAYVVANQARLGGAFATDGGSLELINVVSAWNEASEAGGSVYALDASLSLINTTSGEDDAADGGGWHIAGTSAAEVVNSAVWGSDTGACATIDVTATFAGSYNNVYGCGGGNYDGISDPTGADGNISSYPFFVGVTTDGDPTDDDWHLQSSSPMVDAGDPSSAYDDADGSQADIGAFGGPASDWD